MIATNNYIESKKATCKAASKNERTLAYTARCKELEAEALAQMPYKVGDTVTSRYGDTGRVIEMHPEVTGDIDSPHLIYEYDGKPTVNVVILDTDGKRHCAHWSFFTLQETLEITEAEGVKVGDKVKHAWSDEVATVTSIRKGYWDASDGEVWLFTLDFGKDTMGEWKTVLGPFKMELNGGDFRREAFTVVPDYYSEYQKLGHQEQRPQEWLNKTTNEKRAAYYRACVELERLAGDGLPLVIRADSADLSVNPWNALEKRVKTARVFHLGDRVKMQYPYQCDEVTGTICGIRFGQGCTWLGGWCTHYDVRFDEEYQRPNNFGGKDTGVGMVSPERIELVERAEFCPEPAADWLQPGEKVAHYLDYGDGTGDWLTGNVTGYELCDDGTVIVIYGEYRTPLKNMVKYRYEMDHKTA